MTRKAPVIGLALLAAAACNAINSDLLGSVPKDAPDAAKDAAAGADANADMPEPGLVLRYTFEDSGSTARDISGQHKDGTVFLVNAAGDTPTAAAWTADGRNGRAIALAGSQYVAFPDGVLAGVDDFSIATWVRVRTTSDWGRIYDFGNGSQFMYLTIRGFPMGLTTPDGLQASSFVAIGNENVFATNTVLPTSVWKHIALTGSGGDRRLYIDGFPAGGITGGPNIPPQQMEPTAQNSWIGKSHFATDAKLSATVDDFRIYKRVLTPTEIADLAWPQHDYSYWRFDDATGTSAKDSSDNAVTTTLTPDVTWTTGRLGGAVKLAGAPPGSSGPHIALGASPLASCTEFTVAVWVKLDAVDAAHIFDFGTGSTSFIYLAIPDGTGTGLHFRMGAPAKTTFDQVAAAPSLAADGQWHHVAVTFLSGSSNLYVDGTLLGTQSGSTVKPSDVGATTENWIGRSRTGDRFLSGALDELRIACRAFTADEITNLSRP